jgi:hypothetical protein
MAAISLPQEPTIAQLAAAALAFLGVMFRLRQQYAELAGGAALA